MFTSTRTSPQILAYCILVATIASLITVSQNITTDNTSKRMIYNLLALVMCSELFLCECVISCRCTVWAVWGIMQERNTFLTTPTEKGGLCTSSKWKIFYTWQSSSDRRAACHYRWLIICCTQLLCACYCALVLVSTHLFDMIIFPLSLHGNYKSMLFNIKHTVTIRRTVCIIYCVKSLLCKRLNESQSFSGQDNSLTFTVCPLL